MKKIGLLLLGLCALILTACSSQAKKDDKLHLVTTFYPVYEFTKQVAGDTANVDLLIGAGTEPHDYEPSAKAVAKIQEADAFVYENENMETWAPNVVKNLKNKKTKVIKATENMLLLPGGEEEEDHDHGSEGHHHAYDPHVWLSPQRAIKMVENIRDSLSKDFPKQKKTFEKNAAAYIKKLEKLDKLYADSLKDAKQKNFVTQHTAFAYLALDYGLKQVSISGLSPENEPSAARLAELTKYIKDNQIKYIYFEENASKKVADTLAKETGVQLDVLNPLESLTDKETKAGEDYISIMESNLKALEKTTKQDGPAIAPEKEEDTKTVTNGYFEDSAIKDRELSDWKGDWQSVYPYLKDGTLDQVFNYKAKLTGKMTAAEYKAYYDKGYKTDISAIKITDKTMSFTVNGETKTYTYKYAGKHTLTYSKGNRGVRFMFEATDPDAGEFKYVQFSDHNIAPTKAAHFHIYYGGESQEKLWDELENWPTYYPSKLTGLEIAQEMLAH
ncbi:zinc ABC transporter substrate-binding protein AdcA [Streptococcus massiliensis]|uniref:Zinc-binding lipoprotein AdcA n=1 Tax=Streptococcus massiliensis TaxID=313439 RepID=A0A380KQM0_9STRE|nr:zinc ABC transporter substrate-binding protein AdcA [Streptococcus massiliensis]SUN72167.1 zinc-binding lipoprotein AdcA [Streptococcus massiliensis]SUN76990.1 zinc-binding lipoprotein AdcA [Streptococcus massiliensis]